MFSYVITPRKKKKKGWYEKRGLYPRDNDMWPRAISIIFTFFWCIFFSLHASHVYIRISMDYISLSSLSSLKLFYYLFYFIISFIFIYYCFNEINGLQLSEYNCILLFVEKSKKRLLSNVLLLVLMNENNSSIPISRILAQSIVIR